jgi:hypothetical protein
MSRTSLVLLVLALVLVLGTVGAVFVRERTTSRAPDATSSTTPAPAPHHLPGEERAPAATPEGGASAGHAEQLALEIERALASRDSRQRETAFASVLPALLATDVVRVAALVARLEPGESRDALRDEIARQWIVRDRDAAISWLHSLEDETERKASATIAVHALAAFDPARAIDVAHRFDIGRDDGSLEHMVQIWATEDPEAATRWIESQPDDARTATLRARIEQVRARHGSAPR